MSIFDKNLGNAKKHNGQFLKHNRLRLHESHTLVQSKHTNGRAIQVTWFASFHWHHFCGPVNL